VKLFTTCRNKWNAVPIAFAVLAGILSAGAKGKPQSESRPEVSGTVTYREKMLLPKVADVKILVFELDGQKEPKTIVERLIPTEGRQVPIPFKVLLPQSVNREHDYSLGAEILIGGKLWFSTTKMTLVLTHGNPSEVHMVLSRAS
jgi:putative lipoprotein